MSKFGAKVAASLAAALMVFVDSAHAQNTTSQAVLADSSRLHDFDFLAGDWRVHHRVKQPIGVDEWSEFDGTSGNRALIDGSVNVEEHRFERPAGVSFGVALRAYDPATAQWAIWWIDGRTPHGAMDPPVMGRFENGVGTFYSDGTVDGKPIRVRFIWSGITPTSARWEQAYSADGGRTWETNWIMEFRRAE
jgi:hypothetical protein